MKGQVKFAKVDADGNKEIARRFGVKSFPTIKYFGYGLPKSDSTAKDYKGGRTAADISGFANDLLTKADISPEIYELVSQKVYDDNCQGVTICVVGFLPNIYESSAIDRNNYISNFVEIAKTNRRQPFTFFWLQAGD